MPKLIAAIHLRATQTNDKNRDRDMWSIGTTLAEGAYLQLDMTRGFPIAPFRRSGDRLSARHRPG